MAATKKTKTVEKSEIIEMPKLDLRMIHITLEGVTSLIMHKWSEKAKKQMADKQQGKATKGREKKVPKNDFESSMYEHPDGGYGFPTIAFKLAAVRGAKSAGFAMTDAKGAFHVVGELVPIKGKPNMREDMVRLSGPGGVADIRYRGEFKKWSVTLLIKYNGRMVTAEQLIGFFNLAGFSVGIGEWRPERNGDHGMFHVKAGVN